MNIDEFWHTIELARQRFRPERPEGNMDAFIDDLERHLAALSPDEVVSFRDHLEDRMAESYDFDLWAAAFLIADGCSDDGFEDFRCWLISMGREVFEKALANPDSLAQPASMPGVEDVFFGELRSLPGEVYKVMTGQEIPDDPRPHPAAPTGTRRRDDGADLPGRFPSLWARYGKPSPG